MRNRSDVSRLNLDVDAIVEALEDAPVESCVLFGSYARRDERGTSDVDLAVEFDDSLASTERTKARLTLIERVSTRLGIDSVDVIPIADVSPELRREILEDGVLIYGTAPDLATESTDEASDHDETMARFDDLISDLERVV